MHAARHMWVVLVAKAVKGHMLLPRSAGWCHPHKDVATLELTSIAGCCCVAVIAALNSDILSLLRCDLALLAMLKVAKSSRIVSRILLLFASAALLA